MLIWHASHTRSCRFLYDAVRINAVFHLLLPAMSAITPINTTHPLTLALFCKVVDNYGDIGICWRLARQLHQEHGIAVTLWVDDLRSFQRLCPEVLLTPETQYVAGIQVRHWRDQEGHFAPGEIADIVIEFFGCNIPPGYIQAMAQCTPRPVWLNLEGLTAEEWVEGCHTLPSPHPSLSLTKHFFFPGFTDKTGGLLAETGLQQQRLEFQQNPSAVCDFLSGLGVTPAEQVGLKISLFCYPQAPLQALLTAWQNSNQSITCLVPEGVGGSTVAALFGLPAEVPTQAGMVARHGALSIRVLPFVPQPDYDRLLWACDLNFVRGEDSFVRAQWAGRPFVWHIYAQDENLHHVKLKAFLQRYKIGTDTLRAFSLAWNGADEPADWSTLWSTLASDLTDIARQTSSWQNKMLAHGDLATNLLQFSRGLLQQSQQ